MIIALLVPLASEMLVSKKMNSFNIHGEGERRPGQIDGGAEEREIASLARGIWMH